MKKSWAVFVVLMCVSTVQAAEMTAEDVLKAYERYQDRLLRFSFSYYILVNSNNVVPAQPERTGTFSEYGKGEYSIDSSNIYDVSCTRWITKRYSWGNINERRYYCPEATPSLLIFKWDGKEGLQYQTAPKNNFTYGIINRGREAYLKRQKNPTYMLAWEAPCAAVFGYNGRDRGRFVRIGEAMRVGQPVLAEEMMGDAKCYRIMSDTPNGDIVACFDPAKGFALAKYVIDQQEGDLYSGYPLQRNERRHLDLVVTDYMEDDGVWMPSKVTQKRLFDKRSTNERYESAATFEIRAFDFNPDFAKTGAFEMEEVDDGSEWVYMDDQKRRKYNWNGGKLTPVRSKR